MKIAQIICTYPPYRGGMGRVAEEYTERLRARGHDVHVFVPEYQNVKDDAAYVHRLSAPIRFGNAGFIPSLFSELKRFDVLHLHYPFFGGAEPTVFYKLLHPSQALVMTYHMDAVAGGMKGMFFRAHARLLLPTISRCAQKILVSSMDYAQSSDLSLVRGIFSRVEELPFGVDVARFFEGEEPGLRRTFGIDSDAPVMIFVGGLDPAHHFKGIRIFFEALQGLRNSSWHAMIVGDGALRASYEALAQERGIRDQVHFVGNVSDEELPRYYRMSDLHIFPSTERAEAFGLVALEAAASGIPSIVSDLPGVRTVVRHEETGLHVPARNVEALCLAMERLLQDPADRKRLGKAACVRANELFSWDPLMDRLEKMYQSAVQS